MANFFKKAFQDMKESAKAQHEVDKANFEAVKAESKATWEEAKMSPSARQAKMQKERHWCICTLMYLEHLSLWHCSIL